MIPRIQERTNLSVKEIQQKFEKAIDYIIKKNEQGFFKQKSMVEMFMKKSDFKIMIMINPKDNYIRISTVLSSSMKTKNAIRWKLNEEYRNCVFLSLEINE